MDGSPVAVYPTMTTTEAQMTTRRTATTATLAAILVTGGLIGSAVAANAQDRNRAPAPVPGMARMHELMSQQNPGMTRMHERMSQQNPGMARMHELKTDGSRGARRHCPQPRST